MRLHFKEAVEIKYKAELGDVTHEPGGTEREIFSTVDLSEE